MSGTISAHNKNTYENLDIFDFKRRVSEEKSNLQKQKKHQSFINRLSKISQQTDAVLSRIQHEELKRTNEESSD